MTAALEGSQCSTPRPHFTPGKDPVPILHEAGWAPGPVWMGGKSRPHRDSIPDHQARIQSLYRLSYRAHDLCVCMYICIYIDQKHLESFEMWCWRRMEKISWTDHVRNEEVLLRIKEQRNILHEKGNRRLTGLVAFCVETAFYNGLLKER